MADLTRRWFLGGASASVAALAIPGVSTLTRFAQPEVLAPLDPSSRRLDFGAYISILNVSLGAIKKGLSGPVCPADLSLDNAFGQMLRRHAWRREFAAQMTMVLNRSPSELPLYNRLKQAGRQPQHTMQLTTMQVGVVRVSDVRNGNFEAVKSRLRAAIRGAQQPWAPKEYTAPDVYPSTLHIAAGMREEGAPENYHDIYALSFVVSQHWLHPYGRLIVPNRALKRFERFA